MSEPTKVRTGQVWAPVTEFVPSLKVTAVKGGFAECAVVGRDRTMRVKASRLLSGAAGYACKDE
jgi:hypothetical protein